MGAVRHKPFRWMLVVVFAFAAHNVWGGAAETPKFNVVLITIDTLRADHLGCYGYKSIQTPNIDELARDGVRFTQAFTTVPITLPAHTALLTGEYPLSTGIHDFTGNRLPASKITLAKTLHEAGYRTAAFVAAPVLDSRFGLNQGFDTYYDHFELQGLEEVHLDAIKRRGDRVVDEVMKWVGQHPPTPIFLWVHLYDPHTPYQPPEPFASRYRARPYDGEIAFADAQVGRLMAGLAQHGLLDHSVVVLASDHGEGLGDHGEATHGFFVYNSTLHVPLIFKVTGVVPRVVPDEVSLVDVMPTILQILRIPAPPTVEGRSLLSLMMGHATESRSTLYAENYAPLLHFGWNYLRSLQWQGLKYIQTTRPELYDTRTDPKELNNLIGKRRALANTMRDRLDTVVTRYTPAAGRAAAEGAPTDPAMLESLRSLGYVALSAGTITDSAGKALPDPKDRIQVYELVSNALIDDQKGRYSEALRQLVAAEKTEPHSRTICFLVAQDYYHLKDYSHAASYFQMALELDPKNSLAAYYLGVARLEMGDLQGAETSFRNALALDPKNFSAAYDLGVIYTRRREPEAAVKAFQQAVQILPDYADAREALGELYLFMNRPQDAARELERAVAIAPQMTKAHYQLGRAYAALGLQEKAQKEFDLAKKP